MAETLRSFSEAGARGAEQREVSRARSPRESGGRARARDLINPFHRSHSHLLPQVSRHPSCLLAATERLASAYQPQVLRTPPLRSGRKRCSPPPSAPGPSPEGRDVCGRKRRRSKCENTPWRNCFVSRAPSSSLCITGSQLTWRSCPKTLPSALSLSPTCGTSVGCWHDQNSHRHSDVARQKNRCTRACFDDGTQTRD